MANAFFENYRNLLGGGGTHALPDLSTGGNNIKFHLLDTADHTVSLSADVDEADITNAAIVATSANLSSQTFGTVSVGTFDHADETLGTVTGDASEEIVYWYDTTTDTTSPLICRFDTFASGMPVTPNGGNIDVQISTSGVFTLN